MNESKQNFPHSFPPNPSLLFLTTVNCLEASTPKVNSFSAHIQSVLGFIKPKYEANS